MLNEKWMITDGLVNTGESGETVAARLLNKNVLVAYMAYGGVKVIELCGVVDFCEGPDTNVSQEEISDTVGDDFEVALPVVVEGHNVVLVVDSMDTLTVIANPAYAVQVMPTVESSEDYASDELELAVEDNPALEGLMDVMEL